MARIDTIYYQKSKNQDKRGRRKVKAYRITFKTSARDRNGRRRKTVNLPAGLYTEDAARGCLLVADAIDRAACSGLTLDNRFTTLLESYPDFKKRIAAAGFIDVGDEITLEELWAQYERAEPNRKPTTISQKKSSKKIMGLFFSLDTIAARITKQDALNFKKWAENRIVPQTGKPTAPATIKGYFRDANALFNWAIAEEILTSNPFKGIKTGSYMNPERDYYLPADRLPALLAACPSQDWRVLILLARRLGLRIPSESSALRWENVGFQEKIITIYAPKTDKKRLAPLFPDVAEALEALKREQEETKTLGHYVLRIDARGYEKNLRTQFERIIERAGLDPWPRLFQNLRKSAASDIFEAFGAVAEKEWLGHSQETAMKHYLHSTPETFKKASSWGPLQKETAATS